MLDKRQVVALARDGQMPGAEESKGCFGHGRGILCDEHGIVVRT